MYIDTHCVCVCVKLMTRLACRSFNRRLNPVASSLLFRFLTHTHSQNIMQTALVKAAGLVIPTCQSPNGKMKIIKTTPFETSTNFEHFRMIIKFWIFKIEILLPLIASGPIWNPRDGHKDISLQLQCCWCLLLLFVVCWDRWYAPPTRSELWLLSPTPWTLQWVCKTHIQRRVQRWVGSFGIVSPWKSFCDRERGAGNNNNKRNNFFFSIFFYFLFFYMYDHHIAQSH